MNGQLAGVAAGVRTDLAFKRPLVVVDPQVLLQAAAVCRGVQAVFALVWLLTCVRATVHVELVPPTEALVAQLTFKGLLTWATRGKKVNLYLIRKSPDEGTLQVEGCGVTSVGFQVSFHVFLAVLRLKSTTCRSQEEKPEEAHLILDA